MKAYHFVGNTLRDGRPIPPDGEWLEEFGTLKMCAKGLHASKHPLDALFYAPGFTLCLVELDGEILKQNDKVCAARRKIIARFDAKDMILQFARDCALDVLDKWGAPEVVKEFLETGNPELAEAAVNAAANAAAHAAAHAAARAAARAAVYAAYTAAHAAANAARAADYAARAADYAARASGTYRTSIKVYRDKFNRLVEEKFEELQAREKI